LTAFELTKFVFVKKQKTISVLFTLWYEFCSLLKEIDLIFTRYKPILPYHFLPNLHFNLFCIIKLENMSDSRERDLVLAPNEYAYISDQTKGHIVAYVGPYKTSMANTDQPVYFAEADKQFKKCNLEESIKAFTTVPEGWYITLKNPAVDNHQPTAGTANNLPNLDIGRKVHIPGPVFFALWPGQMVRVIKGHRLKTNQYLLVRVYEEDEATKNWETSVILSSTETSKQGKGEGKGSSKKETPTFPVGKLMVIKGQDVPFYIPPTGIEVVTDFNGNYVRQAITLERLEYCILLDENGNKRYIQGPDVVIPEPTETFFVKNGHKKFKAIELSETSGIYVKVISPYKEGNKTYSVGEELFITGKEQMIYFPRQEHALIKDGNQDIYYAVAIPPGEGRYYLNRKTGQILLEKGPSMFLPDPRKSVIVQRILTDKQADLYYPNNESVKQFNRRLKEMTRDRKERSKRSGAKGKKHLEANEAQQMLQKLDDIQDNKEILAEIASDEFVRSQTYTSAKTITLDTKFNGAVTVDVWTGYAVLVTGKLGQRKVVVGPDTILLAYDEDLAVIELSTGTPKTDERTIKTVYMRVLHNKVSDIVEAETKDLCPVNISLSYRVNFTGEPENWFNVENYVKFLTEHLRSKIRNSLQKLSISDFYMNPIDIIRNVVLGKANEKGERAGGKFEENGMLIYDVEVLDISLQDAEIETLLMDAQHNNVRRNLEIIAKNNILSFTKESEAIDRQVATEKSNSKQQLVDLQMQEVTKSLSLTLTKLKADIETKQTSIAAQVAEQKELNKIQENEIGRERAVKEMNIQISDLELQQTILGIKAEVDAVVQKAEAVSPDLIAALQSFSDKALAEKMATSMAPLSIIGGKSIAEVFSNMLRGTVLENVLEQHSKGK
jgi:major vault protein